MGDFEAAVTLLLATPPNNPLFYMDSIVKDCFSLVCLEVYSFLFM